MGVRTRSQGQLQPAASQLSRLSSQPAASQPEPAMFIQLSSCLTVCLLLSQATGRPSIGRTFTQCENAIFNCCSSSSSTFHRSSRCFELNGCPGINFMANPCELYPDVLNSLK